MLAEQALDRFIRELPAATPVLDVGSGTGAHAAAMRRAGLNVTTLDVANPEAMIQDNYIMADLPQQEAIWCSHVLEHQRNVGIFLEKIYDDLKIEGLLGITVPPMRTKLVSGHVNQFTPGTLIYQLILAGFNCSGARVGMYGYNLSVLVRKMPGPKPEQQQDREEIDRLAPLFPWKVTHGIESKDLWSVRW